MDDREDAVHGCRALVDDRSQLFAVDGLGDLRSSDVADQAGDLFDRDAFVGQQRDAAVPQLAGCPGIGVQAAGGGDVAEAASDLVRVEGGAVRRREHDIVGGPSGPCALASGGLAVVLLAERDDRTMR